MAASGAAANMQDVDASDAGGSLNFVPLGGDPGIMLELSLHDLAAYMSCSVKTLRHSKLTSAKGSQSHSKTAPLAPLGWRILFSWTCLEIK